VSISIESRHELTLRSNIRVSEVRKEVRASKVRKAIEKDPA
jgi:hypothetical protein